MRTHLLVAGLAAALTLTGAGAGTATAAAPQAATCGAVLTTDAYLPGDLNCTADNGITLSGKVTLDLRGHRLTGPGETSSSLGITVSGGPATVKNGTVEGWRAGLGQQDDEGTPSATLRGVRFSANSTGIASFPLNLDLDRVIIEGGDAGISAFFDPTITITRSVVRANRTGVGIGSGHLTISGSQIVDNSGGGVNCSEAFCTLRGNRIAGNAVGIVGALTGVDATGNDFVNNGAGYRGGTLDTPKLVGNRFTGNDIGVAVTSTADVTIRDNVFTGNDAGVRASEDADSYRGTLTGNRFTRNGDGVSLPAAQDMSLGGNRAVRNTGWGIYAPGATDLGGNTARGNGNSPQCVGVTC